MDGFPFANMLLLSIVIDFVWQVLRAMSVLEFTQSRKRVNNLNDIVLRTLTISIKERMMIFSSKGPFNNVDSILEFGYPNVRKNFKLVWGIY